MDIKSRFEAFSKAAHLDLLLPKSPDFDAVALLRNGTPEDVARAPARRNLFFDEQAQTLVVLKTSQPEVEVRDILSHLELILAAHATDAVPQGSGNAASASGKHDLGSRSFPATTFVDIVPLNDKTYVIWKPALHLARPRARIQRPAIYFTANLTVGSGGARLPRWPRNDYLKSYEPLPANILEPLQFDPALAESNVSLPETRITKVAPKATNLQDVVKPIRGASKRAFPAMPAVFTTIRYSSLPDAIIASLHLETSPVIAGTISITTVGFDIADAEVEHLTDVTLPLETRAGDETIILYRIQAPTGSRLPVPGEARPVSISINANASLDQGSRITLSISWQTQVDLSQTLSKPIYKWSRPISMSSAHHQRGQSLQSSSGLVSFETSSAEVDTSITFHFTGPATTQKGSEFKLEVMCYNRSARPRRFALVMVQPRRPRAITQFQSTSKNAHLVASIFNAPPLERFKQPDVLDLNPDVRFGPLPPGACFETHMRFRALKTGVLDLGVLRILDLDSRRTVDVTRLPDIVASEGADSDD